MNENTKIGYISIPTIIIRDSRFSSASASTAFAIALRHPRAIESGAAAITAEGFAAKDKAKNIGNSA